MATTADEVATDEPARRRASGSSKVAPAPHSERSSRDEVYDTIRRKWPGSGWLSCRKNWDAGFEFDLDNVFHTVDRMTDWNSKFGEGDEDGRLSHEQGRQLLGYYRTVGGEKALGYKQKLIGQTLEVIGAVVSAVS